MCRHAAARYRCRTLLASTPHAATVAAIHRFRGGRLRSLADQEPAHYALHIGNVGINE